MSQPMSRSLLVSFAMVMPAGLAGLVCVRQAAAEVGWFIEQVGEGGDNRQHLFIQANRMKTLMLKGGQPAQAFILDLNGETITQVDYERRQYVTATIDEYVQTIQGAMAQANAAMEQAMAKMPPEQRKMMEQMMRGRQPAAAPGSQACRDPKVSFKKTQEQATIAGFKAVRHEVATEGKPQSELWLAKDLTAWKELDPRKLERFSSAMAKLAACNPSGGGGGASGASWKMTGEGYPVRTVSDGHTLEVVKAEHRAISAAEFQPPTGFARKTLADTMGGR